MALPLLPLLIGAAPGILSGISNIFDGKRRKAEEGKASNGISELVDLFKQQMGTSYFDSGEAKGAMTAIRDNEQENLNQIDATAAINGMTDEAKLAMKGKQNKATAGAFADLSRSADLWRRRNQQAYQGGLAQLYGVGENNRGNFNQATQNIFGPMQENVNGAINAGLFDDIGTRNQVAKETGWKPNRKISKATTGIPGPAGLLTDFLSNYKKV